MDDPSTLNFLGALRARERKTTPPQPRVIPSPQHRAARVEEDDGGAVITDKSLVQEIALAVWMARTKARLNRRDAAKKADVRHKTYRKLEDGEGPVSLYALRKVCFALNLDLDALLGDDPIAA